MTEDEERHADEVNIAFMMGIEWERKKSKARIEKLEAALLVALGMLSEMGLSPAEKCELAYEHLLKTGARNER